MEKVLGFRNQFRFLSNFWIAPIQVGGMNFATSEHAYQAAKSLDPEDWRVIQKCNTPGAAKKAGRYITMRPDWDQIKLEAMEEILRAKFDQHQYLMKSLKKTKPWELIEENTWGDTFWGVCKGIGHNHLGILLMKIRE